MSDIKIVIVDDEFENLCFLQRVLNQYDVEIFTSPLEALHFMENNPELDLLITGQRMPELSGIELVLSLREKDIDIVSLIVSSYMEPADLIDAVNSRLIFRYIVKPFLPHELQAQVRDALRHTAKKRAERYRLHVCEDKEVDPFHMFKGMSPQIQRLREQALFYAESESPLFIHGETGTGKEVLSRAIHSASSRKDAPFVAVNCGALSKDLFLSELFGHVKGAFSGASSDKAGFVQRAHGGTLFLDEIADIPPEHQGALLRFIQFSTFYPVGSSQEKYSDVRIISASHVDLKALVEQDLFRDDLYYRLSGFSLSIPPLRDRSEDIAYFLLHHLEKQGIDSLSIDDEVWTKLLSYPWKGNVRELIHACEKIPLLMKIHKSNFITSEVIDDSLTHCTTLKTAIAPQVSQAQEFDLGECTLIEYLSAIEERIIKGVYKQTGGNISRTARKLGLSRQGLKNKLFRLGILGQDS